MRNFLMILLAMAFMVSPAFPCSGNDCGDQEQDVDVRVITSHSFESITTEKARFTPANPSHVKIGEVSKPVMQWNANYQVDEDPFSGDRSSSFQIGLSGPILFGKTADSALGTEARRLEDNVRHTREVHQYQMAKFCTEIHTMLKRTEHISDGYGKELWDSCLPYEHFNNDATMKVLEARFGTRHNHGDGMNKDQFSPHSEPYKDK